MTELTIIVRKCGNPTLEQSRAVPGTTRKRQKVTEKSRIVKNVEQTGTLWAA